MSPEEEWEDWYLSEHPEDDPCAPFPGEFMEWDFAIIQKLINEAKSNKRINLTRKSRCLIDNIHQS